MPFAPLGSDWPAAKHIVKHDTWSDYWRLGELTTLTHFRQGYTGELAGFWNRLVDPLPSGGRVVDLATGNGAVALVVLRRARSRGLTLTVEGVDEARIDPVANAGKQVRLRDELAAIRFHPGTPLECTGLPDAHYDLVTSQYGIEYGDLAAAAREIARLLRPGGRFGAILHSADSNVARTATQLQSLLTLLLDDLDLPGHARRLVLQLGDARDAAALARSRQSPADAPLWSALEDAVARAQRFAAPDHEMRMTTQGFLQRVLAPFGTALASSQDDKLALIDQAQTKARSLLQRMAALRSCALDPAALDRFLEQLVGAGLVPEPPQSIEFGVQREKMGYGVVARRAS